MKGITELIDKEGNPFYEEADKALSMPLSKFAIPFKTKDTGIRFYLIPDERWLDVINDPCFTPEEIQLLRGKDKALAESALNAKLVFKDATIVEKEDENKEDK
jgi:hypothetical protein